MNVSFVPYKQEFKDIGKEVIRAVERCARNGDFVYRKDIVEFEENIARLTATKYAVSTDSCTGAMFISLKAAGIGAGDEVITVAHTYIATIDVIIHAGAKPVLVDIEDDFTINPYAIESAITPNTKAIIPVHLNGHMADMKHIMAIARKHNLIVIEDAAQALGARFAGVPAGAWGLTGCFSFYPAKILGSYGEGGVAVTNDRKIYEKMIWLRDHGELPSYVDKDRKHKIYGWGYNTIMDNIQAAILNVKLKHFPRWLERRQEIASLYDSGLFDVVARSPRFYFLKYGDVHQNYVILAPQRDRLRDFLKQKGIETLVSWEVPNHRQPALYELHKFKLPVTEEVSTKVLSLPLHPYLTNKEVEYVIKCIRKFYKAD